jgi:hypothetical protein
MGFEDDGLNLGADEATLDEGQDQNLDNLDLEGQDGGGQDEDPVIEIDGEEVPLSEVRRWRDTRKNLEADFTKKYQGLATQRKQLEPLMNWFRANPQQAQVLAAVADGQMTPQQALQYLSGQRAAVSRQAAAQTGHQVPPEVLNRLSQMEQVMASQLQAQADQQITATLASLAERAKAEGLEWTPEFEQEILQTAYDNKTSNLEHVYEALAYRHLSAQIAAAKKQGEKETLQNLQQKRQKAGNILGGQQRGGAAPAKVIKDYKGATEAALADEALMKSLFTE